MFVHLCLRISEYKISSRLVALVLNGILRPELCLLIRCRLHGKENASSRGVTSILARRKKGEQLLYDVPEKLHKKVSHFEFFLSSEFVAEVLVHPEYHVSVGIFVKKHD